MEGGASPRVASLGGSPALCEALSLKLPSSVLCGFDLPKIRSITFDEA